MILYKKDYQSIANIIKKFEVVQEGLTREFIELLSENPKFDKHKFIEAYFNV